MYRRAKLTVHSNVASKKLLPHLDSGTAQSTSPHLLAEQSEERNTLGVLSGSNSFANFNEFSLYPRVVEVTFGMQESQGIFNLLPTTLGSEPTRALREEEQRAKKDEPRNALDTPSDAESRRTAHALSTAVGDQELWRKNTVSILLVYVKYCSRMDHETQDSAAIRCRVIQVQQIAFEALPYLALWALSGTMRRTR